MSYPVDRTIALSPARRLACDVLHFAQKVPLVVLERRMRLADVARARAAIPTKPSWFAVFAKAYGVIAARRPVLRRSYLTLPWPRLFEHARNVAVMPIERRLRDENVILYVSLAEPERQTIQQLDARIRQHKSTALENDSFFQTQLWTSRLPRSLRRLLWWLGLNLLGRVRAYFYGTFGITSVSAFGSCLVTILPPLTTTLTYGVVEEDGSVMVRLCFDHRVMDGAEPARALADLEEVLNGEIVAELRQMVELPEAA
jgi:hypothetical protein